MAYLFIGTVGGIVAGLATVAFLFWLVSLLF